MLKKRLSRASLYSLCALAIGLIALIGRVFEISVLYQVMAGFPETSFNTITMIVLMSAALLIRDTVSSHTCSFWAVFSLAGIVGCWSLMNLIEFVSGSYYGLVQLDVSGELRLASLVSSPHTSWLFFLLSSAMLTGLLVDPKQAFHGEQLLVIIAAFFELIFFTGYLNQMPLFYSGEFSLGISLVTLSAMVCLTVSVLLLHRDKGYMKTLFQQRTGSYLLRRGLIFVLVGLVTLSQLRNLLTSYELVISDGIVITLLLAMALVFLYSYAVKINAIEEGKDRVEGYFEEVFNASPNGMVLVDRRGEILLVNEYLATLSQYSVSELKGMAIETLVPKHLRRRHQIDREAYVQNPHRRIVGSGKRLSLLKKDGSSCPVDVSISPAHVNGEQITVAAVVDLKHRIKLEENLQHLERKAYLDALTQVNNREWFEESIDFFLEGARRLNKKVAFCFCDLDGFKQINDDHGHGIGDDVLIEVSKRMKQVTRKGDAIIRYGGDEFLIILNHISQASDVDRVMKALLNVMSTPIVIGNLALTCSASIGVSLFPDDGLEPQELVEQADHSLYKVKSEGKNNYAFGSPKVK